MSRRDSSRTPRAKKCDCGGLSPRPGDKEIKGTDTVDSVWSQVLLTCDDDTGVFFFRHKRRLFMRVVECG